MRCRFGKNFASGAIFFILKYSKIEEHSLRKKLQTLYFIKNIFDIS